RGECHHSAARVGDAGRDRPHADPVAGTHGNAATATHAATGRVTHRCTLARGSLTAAPRRRPRTNISGMSGGGANGHNGNGSLNELIVESVRVHMLSSQHVVILRDTGHD